jgi:hypothetical protein
MQQRTISWPLAIVVFALLWGYAYLQWREGVGLSPVLAGLVTTLVIVLGVAALLAGKTWWDSRRERRRQAKAAPRRSTGTSAPRTLERLYRDRPDLFRRRKEGGR